MDFLDRKLWNMGVNQLVMGSFICFRVFQMLISLARNVGISYDTQIPKSNAVTETGLSQSIVVDPYAFEDPVLCIVPWPWNDFNGTQPFFADTLESRSDEGVS